MNELTDKQKEEVCGNCAFRSNESKCENPDSPNEGKIVGQQSSCDEFENENEENNED